VPDAFIEPEVLALEVLLNVLFWLEGCVCVEFVEPKLEDGDCAVLDWFAVLEFVGLVIVDELDGAVLEVELCADVD
jgi:hypothetical protein